MAHLQDLSPAEQVRYVKDNFGAILTSIKKNTAQINEYFKLSAPKHKVATLEKISDKMSPEEKDKILAHNAELEAKVREHNAKLDAEYAEKLASIEKIKETVKALPTQEWCICDVCINPNILNGRIPPELEPLIDVARKQAESATY